MTNQQAKICALKALREANKALDLFHKTWDKIHHSLVTAKKAA